MLKRALAITLGAAACAALPAAGEDLMQIYRDAVANDPTLASARANWLATQEVVPQARAGLLPAVTLQGNANRQNFYERLHNVDPGFSFSTQFPQYNYTVSAAQPLYRKQNLVAYDQAKQELSQSDSVLASAQQDLIVRVAQAYFDVLLAQFTIELTESQKAAVSENLAQAKRNFEVGTATITDTNDAQAKYDQIVAQELLVQNDLENRLAALRAIIGRAPKALKRFGGDVYEPQLPTPNALEAWIEMSLRDNLQVHIAQSNYDIAVLEVDRQRAGHYPTLDLVASFNQGYQGASASLTLASVAAFDSRLGLVGVQLNVPLYLGGSIESKVRQAVAGQEKARQDLEAARRTAQLATQTAFTGVTSGFAQIGALKQALTSAQVSYDSTRVGLEVGVRTNLDVLNQQQQVFQTRFNLAQAYYNFVISGLKLKQAVGTLSETDLEQINRSLSG